MFPFRYLKATDEQAALQAAAAGGRYIAGGTTLVDLMRETVERPDSLVDINALPYRWIEVQPEMIRVGSLVRMSDLAAHPVVRQQAPVISQALELSASAQLRNMASIGGNLLQRPRCLYFRDVSAACNRRAPGTGCSAIDGRNRSHAILGTSRHCCATHPSDLAVALVALDAVVVSRGASGRRRFTLAELFCQPGDTPHREHNLEPGELIVGIEVPLGPEARRSGYLKVRDRQSYQFALASAAVALDIVAGTIRSARVAVGGVATVPWRLPAVERELQGRPIDAGLFRRAAELSVADAQPLRENGFKVGLLRRTVERQLATVAAMP
ncbi:FAD-binding molybdopterin dehydrogenase [Mycobacterium persicum]|uniref:FAD-binding molybdopterin dehydrogenase n=1 Tax=Mycobacterium persicum TaxID=1487726 RepID=A0A8E2LP60_9MYCO|nr:xanthine dehydrogenase family protein subunit M [Mycobacterium persicum]KZS84271.1 FAD-binding molybdopterin dehydrogenase [Mycobacterium persicum]ORB55121.1 FAD-binding molybdopterin dehydrogenase [Mycobacterium persicum]ORB96175.1 FAD-binding molybdopterin dehydrogenase [Mycobacterium persicum]ORC08194.1 FAD-binding molybdopterin dehydrogenase [Mycobacterium persicum]VAZ71538.1 Putative xanthine dehydrogenase YagS FAD-binding subunit [Mycobacterium persicum]